MVKMTRITAAKQLLLVVVVVLVRVVSSASASASAFHHYRIRQHQEERPVLLERQRRHNNSLQCLCWSRITVTTAKIIKRATSVRRGGRRITSVDHHPRHHPHSSVLVLSRRDILMIQHLLLSSSTSSSSRGGNLFMLNDSDNKKKTTSTEHQQIMTTGTSQQQQEDNNKSNNCQQQASDSDWDDVNSSIRWGIIGVGDVTEKKSGPAFFKSSGSELVAVMRRTPGKAQEWIERVVPQEKREQVHAYDNVNEFLADAPKLKMDAVYIATHPGSHLELGRRIIDEVMKNRRRLDDDNNDDSSAGSSHLIRAIYVEKPVGRCSAETRELARLCHNAKIQFYTAYISRAYERTQFVKRLLIQKQKKKQKQNQGDQEGNHDYTVDDNDDSIDAVSIGDVKEIKYRLIGTGGARGLVTDENGRQLENIPWRLNPIESGGGLIMDVGCHIIDRIEYICNGPLINLSGIAERRGDYDSRIMVEDYVEINATIGNDPSTSNNGLAASVCQGATVSCFWDFSGSSVGGGDEAKEEIDELSIIGTNGTLRMVGMSPSSPVSLYDSNGKFIREWDIFEQPHHTAQNMIQAITNELRRNPVVAHRGSGVHHHDCVEDYISRDGNAIRTSKVLDVALATYYGNRNIKYWVQSPDKWPGYQRSKQIQKTLKNPTNPLR